MTDYNIKLRIEQRGDCFFLYGALPIGLFNKIVGLAPSGSVMSTTLARVMGANIAFGPSDQVAEIINLNRFSATAQARKLYENATVRKEYPFTSLSDKAIQWLAIGEHGRSSVAMFNHLTGVSPRGMNESDAAAHPLDPDDFRRCRLLIEQVPELLTQISMMSSISQVWAALVGQWAEICEAMDQESPNWRARSGKANTAHELIEQCLKAGEKQHV